MLLNQTQERQDAFQYLQYIDLLGTKVTPMNIRCLPLQHRRDQFPLALNVILIVLITIRRLRRSQPLLALNSRSMMHLSGEFSI